MELIVKTPIGLERVAAARIQELDSSARLEAKPLGLEGIVVVEETRDRGALMAMILSEVLEAERVVPVEEEVEAEVEEIAAAAARLAEGRISPDESFAVRTVRRGSHGFRSVDVNIRAGEMVQRATGALVNLDYPDKIVQVEIIKSRAALAILDGRGEWRKMSPGKRPSASLFNRVAVVQMPYLGSFKGAREVGRRVGRAAQAYEVQELVIAISKPAEASELAEFIRGVDEGVESRYSIQQRSYGRRVERVRRYVQDLYQLVRERRGEPIIVFEPEGKTLLDVVEDLRGLMQRRRVNFLFGSREGIPKGIYRAADLVIDLAPGVTLPTELAAPAALSSIYTALSLMTGDELSAEPAG